MRLGKSLKQRGGNHLLGENIGLGDKVDGGCLFGDGASAQVPEAGHDLIRTAAATVGNEENRYLYRKGSSRRYFFIREGGPP